MKGSRGLLMLTNPHANPTLSSISRDSRRRGRGSHSLIQPFGFLCSQQRDITNHCKFFTTTTSVPSTVNYSSAQSLKILLSDAYNEARRSLEANTNIFPPQATTVAADDSEHHSLQKDSNHILKAANDLLEVSKNHVLLKEAISTSDALFRKHVDVLHRAFLSLTSKCLDQATQDDSSPIRLALNLAERAGKIGLPIHTPLHNRIMETAAQCCPRDIPLMLNIAALSIQNSPEVISCALQALIQKEHFALAETLFEEMPIYLTRTGVKDIFIAIRNAQEFGDFSARRISRLCRLVQHLELSVQKLIMQDHGDRVQNESRAVVSSDDSDSPDSIDHLVEAIVEYSRSTGSDHEFTEDNDSEYSIDLDSVQSSDDDDSSPTIVSYTERREDAMDHAALSVLLTRVEDPRVCKFLADLVGCSYQKLSRGTLHIDRETNLDYFVESSTGTASSTQYMAGQPASWKLPDITDQLVRLNGGAELEFSKEYEDILFEEENRLSGGFLDDDKEDEDSDFDDYYSSDSDE